MKKNYLKSKLLYITLFMFSTASVFSQTINIGRGSAPHSTDVPIKGDKKDSYSQQIVLASEYSAGGGVAGNITKLSYYLESGDLNNSKDWTVYIGHTNKIKFNTPSSWEPVSNLTEVFSGNVTLTSSNWVEITFTTPFNYNGTDNFVIAVDENEYGESQNYTEWSTYKTQGAQESRGLYISPMWSYSPNIDPANPPTGIRSRTIAKLKFEGTNNSTSSIGFLPENENSRIKLIPNPVVSGGLISLVGINEQIKKITIFNNLSQKVYECDNCSKSLSIDLEAGIYFVKINETDISKLIVN